MTDKISCFFLCPRPWTMLQWRQGVVRYYYTTAVSSRYGHLLQEQGPVLCCEGDQAGRNEITRSSCCSYPTNCEGLRKLKETKRGGERERAEPLVPSTSKRAVCSGRLPPSHCYIRSGSFANIGPLNPRRSSFYKSSTIDGHLDPSAGFLCYTAGPIILELILLESSRFIHNESAQAKY